MSVCSFFPPPPMWIFLVHNGYVFDVSACGDTCKSAGKLCGMLLGTTMFKDKDLCIVRFPETFGSAVTAVILVTCEPTVIASIDNKSQISNTAHLQASIAWFVGGKSCYVLGKTTLNLHINKLFTDAVTTTYLGNVKSLTFKSTKKGNRGTNCTACFQRECVWWIAQHGPASTNEQGFCFAKLF